MYVCMYVCVSKIDGLELYGPSPSTAGVTRTSLVAFNSKAVHATDLSFFLDQEVLYVCMYVCTYICMYVYVCMHASMYIYMLCM